nr:hypothetical protein [Tanacetum cinerariifolium]
MDYFKGMTYDDMRSIFKNKFNSNVAFLLNTKEQIDEEDSKALKRLSESQDDKTAKKQKLDEEVEELKRHLQIVPNDEDGVYTEAIPLALKVPSKELTKCSWSSEGQELEAVRVLWCADYHIYYNTVDFAGREEISTYKKEVNELRAERLARNANPLALVATAQADQDPYYQTSKSYKSYAPSGKDMQKNLALIAKYFKKIYKPTNNNLITSSNLRNKNVDTTLWYKNDNQSGQFRNQRTMNVVGARENVGSPVVQQSGIQCFNCKEFGHFSKECRKPKRVKDSAYHKEMMLLCKQAEKGVPLKAEQYDWLEYTNEEIDEQELEAHYNYMAKIQEVPTTNTSTDSEPLKQVQNDTGYNVFSNDLKHSEQSESINNTCLVETNDSNIIPDSPDMCDDIQNDQNDVESDDEHVVLANLIANVKLDVDKNKKIQKQLKKSNTTLSQEMKKCKTILAETSKTLGESNSVRDSFLVTLQNKQTQFERQLAQKDIEIKEGLKTKAYEISMVKEKHDELIKQSLLTKSYYAGLVKQKTKQEMHADLNYVESLEKEIDELESDKAKFSNMYDMILQEFWNEQASNVFRKEREKYINIQDLKAYLQDKNIAISELNKLIEKGKGKSVETKFDKPYVVQQPNAQRIPKPSVLGQPAPFSNSLKRRYFPKKKSVSKTNVSEGLSKLVTTHTLPQTARQAVSNTNVIKPGLYRIDNSLNSRTSNVNVVCATCGKCLVDSNHFACVTKMLNDVNARTKKPNVVPISTRKPKGQANTSVVTPHKKKVASKPTNQKPQSYFRMLYEKTSKTWKWWISQQSHQDINGFLRQKCNWYLKLRMKMCKKTIVQHILFIVDSGCTKHMTGNLKLLCNFVEKFLGTVRFGNDQFAPVLGYGDLGNDLLTGNRGSDLNTISFQELTSSTPLCLMAKASSTQAWLWHRRLFHLNFDYINQLSKKDVVIGLPKLKYVKDQLVPSSKGRLNLLHMDLCGPMQVASINGKKYILVIVDDYSRYTWTLFLHSKDETPEVLKEFLTMIQRNLQAPVITVRTDRGTEFLNKTLNAFFK